MLCLQLCAAVNERALAVVEEQMLQQDALMTQLAQEFDNGRLLRLLARLVMVSEGSQTALDPSWSETGKLKCRIGTHSYIMYSMSTFQRAVHDDRQASPAQSSGLPMYLWQSAGVCHIWTTMKLSWLIW